MRKPKRYQLKKNPWAQAAAFARARKLSPERRKEIAIIASRAAAEKRMREREARELAEAEPASA